MKKNKIVKFVFKLLGLLLLIISLLCLFLILKYNILPLKYLIIYIIIFTIIPSLLFLILIRKKKSKVFINIISIIYLVIMFVIFNYLNKTFNFINGFIDSNYSTINYYIIVEKKNLINIKDVNNIGIVNANIENIDNVLVELNKIQEIDNKEYDNYDILYEDLLNKNIDSILMSESYYDIYSEEKKDFRENIKIIYKFSIRKEINNTMKDANVIDDSFVVYISGIDSDNDVTSQTRSDVNIIGVINPKTYQVLLINIPRDYYVEFPNIGEKDKLTHAGLYGIETSVETLSKLLEVEVNYYLRVNYSALINLVDALDGVDVYSEYDFYSTDDNFHYNVGYNHVNGNKALQFVRTRKAFAGGDRVRGQNQQSMISAIISKLSSSQLLLNYNDILNSLEGSFMTNISPDDITKLVKLQLGKMPSWNVKSISLEGSDGNEFSAYFGQNLYVMIPNEETVLNAIERIDDVFKGKILT